MYAWSQLSLSVESVQSMTLNFKDDEESDEDDDGGNEDERSNLKVNLAAEDTEETRL